MLYAHDLVVTGMQGGGGRDGLTDTFHLLVEGRGVPKKYFRWFYYYGEGLATIFSYFRTGLGFYNS